MKSYKQKTIFTQVFNAILRAEDMKTAQSWKFCSLWFFFFFKVIFGFIFLD